MFALDKVFGSSFFGRYSSLLGVGVVPLASLLVVWRDWKILLRGEKKMESKTSLEGIKLKRINEWEILISILVHI